MAIRVFYCLCVFRLHSGKQHSWPITEATEADETNSDTNSSQTSDEIDKISSEKESNSDE